MREKDQARFWSKVLLPTEGDCMRWRGTHVGGGYGQFLVAGRRIGAHRVSYELAYGTIPEGLVIDHVKARGCRFRDCVNPEHLEPVTTQENTARGGLGAVNGQKTHCPHGHPYEGRNLIKDPRGYRLCRTCKQARQRRWEKEKGRSRNPQA